ncbi:MAG: hypothetical protein IJY20_00035 [Clostridia bacterium]|nr:hypothetical protein [Clostridia bacterium]
MSQAFQRNGAAYIREQLRAAREGGKSEVVISGNYEVEDTILLPSDTTLILSDCHLRMRDGTFCQMFRNEHSTPGERHDGKCPDRNIRLLGRGRAILDGGEYNGLSEKTSGKDGMPYIAQNNMVLFCNVEGFEIGGLSIRNQRWWALNHYFCRHGHLHDLEFISDYTRIDENGKRVVGLDRSLYTQTYIKNSDGIDLRAGCHDILIENITGFTEDDTVALTGLSGKGERELYRAEGLSTDIYNVIIRNIRSAAYCTQVRLLNQGGVRLYNILVDGVTDASQNCPYYVGRGVAGVRIGDLHLYGERHSTKDETFNIVVRNVFSRAETALRLAGAMTDCHFDGIYGFDGCPCIIDDQTIKE